MKTPPDMLKVTSRLTDLTQKTLREAWVAGFVAAYVDVHRVIDGAEPSFLSEKEVAELRTALTL